MKGRADEWMDEGIEGRTDGWYDGWMNDMTERRTDGWTTRFDVLFKKL